MKTLAVVGLLITLGLMLLRSQSLFAQPVDRHKIALWTGVNNNITYEILEFTKGSISTISGWITVEGHPFPMINPVFDFKDNYLRFTYGVQKKKVVIRYIRSKNENKAWARINNHEVIFNAKEP